MSFVYNKYQSYQGISYLGSCVFFLYPSKDVARVSLERLRASALDVRIKGLPAGFLVQGLGFGVCLNCSLLRNWVVFIV